jgi:hypothetical protein
MVIRDAKFPAISNIYALVIIVTLTTESLAIQGGDGYGLLAF